MFGKKKQNATGKPLLNSVDNFEWHSRRIAEIEDQLQALYRHLGIYPRRDNVVRFEKNQGGLPMESSQVKARKT